MYLLFLLFLVCFSITYESRSVNVKLFENVANILIEMSLTHMQTHSVQQIDQTAESYIWILAGKYLQRQEWCESDIEVMPVLDTVESSRDSECGFVSVCVGETEGIKPTSGQLVTPRELIKE